MSKFRKIAEIEAEQFFHGQDPETYPPEIFWDKEAGSYAIKTLEGALLVSDGDWIITGIKGEKYACKPDIFALTYEPI
jgi:hypothetical protein